MYVRGEFISHDLEQDLRRESFAVDSIINYTTIPSLDFDSQILEKLNKKLIDIIFIYSKNQQSILQNLFLIIITRSFLLSTFALSLVKMF